MAPIWRSRRNSSQPQGDSDRQYFGKHRFFRLVGALFALGAIFSIPSVSAQKQASADLALVLAVDCSHSVNAGEFRLQMEGLAQAFTSPEVLEALAGNALAVTLVQWSGADDQSVSVDWTIVTDASSAHGFAGAIRRSERQSLGKTSIAGAIDFSLARLAVNPFPAPRQVIDISADGINNDGRSPREARDRAVAAGATINGLTILNDVANLDSYFSRFIIAGPGRFVIPANDYADYKTAIKLKLLREINGMRLF